MAKIFLNFRSEKIFSIVYSIMVVGEKTVDQRSQLCAGSSLDQGRNGMYVGWGKRIRPSLLPGWVFCLVLSLGFSWIAKPAWGKIPDQLLNEIEKLGQQKYRGEDFARRLKEAHAKKKISEPDLERGASLYIGAKAGFNAWIDRVKLDLKNERSHDLSPKARASLQLALEKGEKFTGYVDKLLHGEERGAVPLATLAAGLVRALSPAVAKICGGYQGAEPPEREEIINALEELKWQPFNQIS
jgi:hypothetical protein